MKKVLLTVVLLMVSLGLINAQYLFDGFEVHPDSTYYAQYEISENADTLQCGAVMSLEETEVYEGDYALRYDYTVQRAETWGGYVKYEIFNPDSAGVWDFSAFENLSLWYNNVTPSSDEGGIHLRIEFYDVSDASDTTHDAQTTEFWYSFNYILDDEPGWTLLELPLEDVGSDAFDGSNGFYRTGWAGIEGNNTLDLDQIRGIGFEMSIDGTNTMDIQTGSIIFDQMGFDYDPEFSLVFFNGRLVPADKEAFNWGDATLVVEEEAGYTEGTAALKFTMPNPGPYGGWAGSGWNFTETYMSHVWMRDSLRFWMKAPEGTPFIRFQFESGSDATEDKVAAYYQLDPPAEGYDNTWQQYKIPLKDINTYDTPLTDFDTSAVHVFQIYTGAANGSVVYFDNMWTGDYEIDLIPPADPAPPLISQGDYINTISWIDVANEEAETYNLYYSETMFSSVDDEGVEVVENGLQIAEGTGTYVHYLLSPLADSTVTYYYGITCADADGNTSNLVLNTTSVTNTAKGTPTFSLQDMSSFAPDGDLSEWTGIMPFDLNPTDGLVATNTTVDDAADCSGLFYFAIDEEFIYFAIDVTDDVVDTTSANSWEKDSPDLFLGLYNAHGPQNQGYSPEDLHFRFLPTQAILDNQGGASCTDAVNYHWATQFPTGYIIEGKMALADLADITGAEVFVPENGMRIPFDLSLNDADDLDGTRQGILAWSPYNDDLSYTSPKYWMYSWIGDRDQVILGIQDGIQGVPTSFALDQNYPNPFNPTTTINYRLAKVSDVQLVVFNSLGQKIKTIVNTRQPAGEYQINFDASDLASGVYFYRIKAGNFVKVNKMLLMK